MAMENILLALPNLVAAILLFLIGLGVSVIIWFILKKILEFFRIDEKIKFKFLNKDILIAFWFPILVVAPIVLGFLQSAILALQIIPLTYFIYYLYAYFPTLLKLCSLIIVVSTIYYYLVERKSKPNKKKK